MTAIIVNSRGEVFTGWNSACDVSPSGWESYRTVASFQMTTTIVRGQWDWWPWSRSKSRRQHRTVGKPYVFSSRQAAERALVRMGGLGRAVVS